MEWRAQLSPRPMQIGYYDVYLGRHIGSGIFEVVVGIDDETQMFVLETVGEGEAMPPLLTLPTPAIDALREALAEVAPPPSDSDLREALEHERGRVDKLLDTIVRSL